MSATNSDGLRARIRPDKSSTRWRQSLARFRASLFSFLARVRLSLESSGSAAGSGFGSGFGFGSGGGSDWGMGGRGRGEEGE